MENIDISKLRPEDVRERVLSLGGPGVHVALLVAALALAAWQALFPMDSWGASWWRDPWVLPSVAAVGLLVGLVEWWAIGRMGLGWHALRMALSQTARRSLPGGRWAHLKWTLPHSIVLFAIGTAAFAWMWSTRDSRSLWSLWGAYVLGFFLGIAPVFILEARARQLAEEIIREVKARAEKDGPGQ